jgi:hypothetical protein
MPIFTRVKNILLSPTTEWRTIDSEVETPQSLLRKYVVPMALIPAVAWFIGYGLIGIDAYFFRLGGIKWGIILAAISFITSLVTYFISTYVVDALAPSFGSAKNLGRSAQLVAYSYTAVWVAGVFYIIPSLSRLTILGLYAIYLFYLGIPVVKKTPEDKRITYTIVCSIVIIVIAFVVGQIISNIIYLLAGNPLPEGNFWDLRWR